MSLLHVNGWVQAFKDMAPSHAFWIPFVVDAKRNSEPSDIQHGLHIDHINNHAWFAQVLKVLEFDPPN